MANFKMPRGNAPQNTPVRPEKPFSLPGVQPDSLGNFHVDWETLGLLRPLNDDELLCLKIYAQYKNEHGRFPKSELKHSMIYKASSELRPGQPITRKMVDDYLFVDLFPCNPDINFTTAIRRLLSDARGLLEVEESEQALIHLCELLNRDNDSEVRVIPNTGDVDAAVRQGVFVPGLACLMPTSSALLHSLKPGSWAEICQRILGATREELSAHHALRRELDDLVADYKRAFEHIFPDWDGVTPAVLQYKDLEDFRDHGGIGSLRYKDVFARERRNGKQLNLNSVRELAGLPIDPKLDTRDTRPKGALKLDRGHICVGYYSAWEAKGLHLDPPSRDELDEMVARQSEILKAGLYKERPAIPNSRNGQTRTGKAKVGTIKVLDSEAATKAGVPTFIVPSHSLICRHYDNMAQLLGKIEEAKKIKIVIDDNMRNSRMATEVIKSLRRSNGGDLPGPDAIESYLATIPECVAGHVRGRPAVIKVLGESPRLLGS